MTEKPMTLKEAQAVDAAMTEATVRYLAYIHNAATEHAGDLYEQFEAATSARARSHIAGLLLELERRRADLVVEAVKHALVVGIETAGSAERLAEAHNLLAEEVGNPARIESEEVAAAHEQILPESDVRFGDHPDYPSDDDLEGMPILKGPDKPV